MKTAIIYASKSGATKKAAELLQKKIENADLINIRFDKIAMAGYDNIIIGSFVRMGMFDKAIRKFLIKNESVFVEKQIAFFMCGVLPQNTSEYWKKNVPDQLLKKAVITSHFGGELYPERLRGMDRRIANMVLREDREKGVFHEYLLDKKAINEMAVRMKNNELS